MRSLAIIAILVIASKAHSQMNQSTTDLQTATTQNLRMTGIADELNSEIGHVFKIEDDHRPLSEAQIQSLSNILIRRGLSSAMSQGFIVPKRMPDDDKPVQKPVTFDDKPEAFNLIARTTINGHLRDVSSSTRTFATGERCIPDEKVNVGAWAKQSNLNELGELRSGAIGEDGNVIPDRLQALARYYLYSGFGAEAKIVATEIVNPETVKIINALADIIDGGTTFSSTFDGQATCPGVVSLWAILAKPQDALRATVDFNVALGIFSNLPPHLRTLLGPLLSSRLLAIGRINESRIAISAMTRSGLHTNETDYAQARQSINGSANSQARSTLVRLSQGTNLVAGKSLLELLQDAERRKMRPNPMWVDDAPTLTVALEGTQVAKDLREAELRGLISLQRFEAFRREIFRQPAFLEPGVQKELAKSALQESSSVDDEQFLLLEISLSKILSPEVLDSQNSLKVARRLAIMGAMSRAQRYIPAKIEDAEDVAIAVEILIAQGEILSAVALLENQTTQKFRRILATVHVATGDDSAALPLLAAAGDLEAASLSAIRTANWTWISENMHDQASEAISKISSRVNDFDRELPKNGELISRSKERRRQAQILIQTFNDS